MARNSQSFIIFLIFIVSALFIYPHASMAQGKGGLPETVAIEGGKISGVGVGANKDVRAFKGIPYAKPPVGALRWTPPQPVEAWDGVLEGSSFGPACPQKNVPA